MVIEENKVIIINIYGLNIDIFIFYDMVRDVLLDFDNEYIFFCGDFNFVFNFSIDIENYKGISNFKVRDKFFEIMFDL